MKFKKDWLEKKWVAYTIATCSAVLLYFVLFNLKNIFSTVGRIYGYVSPLVIGLVIAYIISPLAKFIEDTVFKNVKNKSLRNKLSVTLALLDIAVVFILLMVALIPQIAVSIKTLFLNMDSYVGSLQNLLHSASVAAAEKNIDISGLTGIGDNILNALSKAAPENMGGIVATSLNISKAIFDMMIGIILAIYFLADKERLKGSAGRFMKRLLKAERYGKMTNFLERCNSILIRYIAFDIIDGILVGIANFIFMSLMGMPYAVLVSVVVAITNLAPTFGPIVGAVLGGFILVLVDPVHALWFLGFTIVLQTIDGYILKPKLFGGTLGIPGVWILAAIIVGSRVFGVAGILLAIPFAAIVDFIYHDFMFKDEGAPEKKAEEKEKKMKK